MLRRLSIRGVVLIERLDIDLSDGLSVLTGETGAGKSILLDCLGLAVGARADAGLVAAGAQQASVTAAFDAVAGHPVNTVLDEHGLGEPPDGDDRRAVVLRRVLGADGPSRAFVNDQPVSVGLLRDVGEMLVEIQGQYARLGLLDVQAHRTMLDAFAGLQDRVGEIGRLHATWMMAKAALAEAERDAASAVAAQQEIRASVADLEALAPADDEEEALAETRRMLQHAERLIEAAQAASDDIEGAAPGVQSSARRLEKVADNAAGRLDPAIAALDRAAAELAEALAIVQALGHDIEHDQSRLEEVEARLFALRAMARRHGVAVDVLPLLLARQRAQLAALDDQGAALLERAHQVEVTRDAYASAADRLSRERTDAARKLDQAVAKQLRPLKLGRARFTTEITRLEVDDWGPSGLDRVLFTIATNPGVAAGPLHKIASGGELARILLALRVVLSNTGAATTLIFDEVDAGIGGATAASVGERLARLARDRQILVITHSPQVAARGAHHWRVVKQLAAAGARTDVAALGARARREEIARMLSGAKVTDEARAAADRLIEGASA